jgi:uncharacterized cupin superfamily protein
VSKKIHIDQAPTLSGSRYPPPYDAPCRERFRRRLGDAAGLTQFGVNLTRLPPGAWSSQRHWHASEDEFIYVVEGELVLVTNDGEQVLRVGDCAGFKGGVADAHHLQNRSAREALYLEVGTRSATVDQVDYPDVDLRVREGRFEHRDGLPYPQAAPRNPAAGPK